MQITNYFHCKQTVTERLECCTQYSKQKKLKHKQGSKGLKDSNENMRGLHNVASPDNSFSIVYDF